MNVVFSVLLFSFFIIGKLCDILQPWFMASVGTASLGSVFMLSDDLYFNMFGVCSVML